MIENIGHINQDTKQIETLEEHLRKTMITASVFTKKIGCSEIGKIMGYAHDLGKADEGFRRYILSENNLIDSAMNEEIDYLRDHATFGGQYINNNMKSSLIQKMISIGVMSHHTGLINCLPEVDQKKSDYEKRIDKDIRYKETLKNFEGIISDNMKLLTKSELIETESNYLNRKVEECIDPTKNIRNKMFIEGLITKFLFSSLCDADRIETAKFMKPELFNEERVKNTDWEQLIDNFERNIGKFREDTEINRHRKEISDMCYEASEKKKGGILRLSIPTGGGKTLGSLRFAIHHAQKNDMDRILYVLPYTSIIEQNANVTRMFIEESNEGEIVFECHSNIVHNSDDGKAKLLGTGWDKPIVFTTMVQFLESIFSNNVTKNRRMHTMANSIIIFDEIQNIPTKCAYMFNDFIRFITKIGSSTVLLCTATQPLLDILPRDKKGIDHSLVFSSDFEVVTNLNESFNNFSRVEVIDKRENGGWSYEEIADFVFTKDVSKLLVIVNTKESANQLYDLLIKKESDYEILYLSTNMCPEHRKRVVNHIKDRTSDVETARPLICISTQLIEAGVDIDFNCVVRFLAGLDSIAQAAGRCNRNGLMERKGEVYILNSSEENLSNLFDIRMGQESCQRVLDDFKKHPKDYNSNLLGPKAVKSYFSYLYNAQANRNSSHFEYISTKSESTLYEMLSTNVQKVTQVLRNNNKDKLKNFKPYLVQSFETAGREFSVIDSENFGVIVPYGKGKDIINQLTHERDFAKITTLCQLAQKYTVNLHFSTFQQMLNRGIYKVTEELDVYYLSEDLYDESIGITIKTNKFLFY